MYIVQTKLYRFGIVVSFATGKFVDVFLASIFRFFFFGAAQHSAELLKLIC